MASDMLYNDSSQVNNVANSHCVREKKDWNAQGNFWKTGKMVEELNREIMNVQEYSVIHLWEWDI